MAFGSIHAITHSLEEGRSTVVLLKTQTCQVRINLSALIDCLDALNMSLVPQMPDLRLLTIWSNNKSKSNLLTCYVLYFIQHIAWWRVC